MRDMQESMGGMDIPDSGFSRESLDNLSSNRLANMAQQEAKMSKRGKSKLRNKQSRGFAFDMKTPILLLAVVGVVGFLGVQQGWFGGIQNSIGSMLSGITSGGGKGGNDQESRDNETLAEATKLADTYHYSDARKLLEEYNTKYGLTPKLESKLDEIYIQIGKYNAKHGKKKQAVAEFNKVPEDSPHFDEAQQLIQKYSKKSSNKRSSRRRGRRR